MVVACPLLGGSGGRRCGCRPRSGSRRGLSRRRWPGSFGSHVIRRMCGGGAGGQVARLPWPPGVLAGRCAGSAGRSWSGWGARRGAAPGGRGGAGGRRGGAQLGRLRAALEAGPAVWGWGEDQRWTLARVTKLMGRLVHVRDTLRGTSAALHRLGYTPQMPVHRAAERDEAKIAAWRAVTWAKARG